MYIESVPNRASPPAILLRESYREAGKVKKRTLLNLSDWPHERIAGFKALLLLFTAALGQLGYARRHPVQTLFLGLRDLIDGLGEGTTEVLKGDLLTKSFGSEPGICLQFAELRFDIRPQNL